MLGTNDSKPQNWQYKSDLVSDYETMIDVFRGWPSAPWCGSASAVPAFYVNYSIQPDIIRNEILPLIDRIGQEKNVPVIDLYTAVADGSLFPDGIHPNAVGAGVMAQTIAPYLLGVRFSLDFNHDGIVNFTDFARWPCCGGRATRPSMSLRCPTATASSIGWTSAAWHGSG